MLLSCNEAGRRVMRLGCNVWPGYAPLFLAADQGYLQRDRFRVIQFPSATEVLRALENGLLEAAAVTLDEALLLRARGLPVKCVLVTDISHGGDALIARPWIEHLSALRGHRIGVEGTGLGAYMVSRALEQAGLAPGDVEVVQLTIAEQEGAFNAGTVDALVTFDPVRTRLLKGGARELFTSRDIPGEIVDVVVVAEPAIATWEHHLRTLVDSWFRALEDLWRNPAEAAQRLAPRLGLDVQETLSALGRMHLPDRSEVVLLLGNGSGSLVSVMDRLQRVMLDKGLLDRPVDLGNVLDPRFVSARGGG